MADRDGAVHHQQVAAIVFVHRGFAGTFRAVPGGGLQGMVVVERDRVEDQLLDSGSGAAGQ